MMSRLEKSGWLTEARVVSRDVFIHETSWQHLAADLTKRQHLTLVPGGEKSLCWVYEEVADVREGEAMPNILNGGVSSWGGGPSASIGATNSLLKQGTGGPSATAASPQPPTPRETFTPSERDPAPMDQQATQVPNLRALREMKAGESKGPETQDANVITNENLDALDRTLRTGAPLPQMDKASAEQRMLTLADAFKGNENFQSVVEQAGVLSKGAPEGEQLPFPAYLAQASNVDDSKKTDPQMAAFWVAGNQYMNALAK